MTVVGHRQLREHAAHQGIPIGDAAGGVVALVAVGRRREAQRHALARHQGGDHVGVGGVAADQAMRADGPDVARAGYRRGRNLRHVVGVVRRFVIRRFGFWFFCGGQQVLQFTVLEAGECQLVSGLGQLGQFQRQHLLIPARIQRQPVVGNDVGALLHGGQVRQFDHRHLGHAQLVRRRQPPVSRDDAVVAIDQDRVRPAVLDNAGRDLGDLRFGVRARVAGVGDQRLDLAVLDVQWVQGFGFQKNKRSAVSAQPKTKPADGRCRGRVGVKGANLTGCEPRTRANLGSHPDARKASRSRPPHGLFRRKGPFRLGSVASKRLWLLRH